MSDIAVQQLALRTQMQMQLEAQFPATIFIRGLTPDPIAAAGGILRDVGGELMIGGHMVQNDLAFRARKSLFTDPPEVNTRLTFNEDEYLIGRVVNSPHDVAYIIGCDNLSK